MTRLASIDCGTNSIRLLVADHDAAAGTLTDRLRRTELVRLGQDVDRTGRLATEAIERTRVAIASYAADCKQEQVEKVRMVATSATRDAANRDDFRAMVLRTLEVEPEVISGREEAELSFVGAVRELTDAATPRRRGSSLTSAVAPPNWCSATAPSTPPAAWTSGRYG